MRDRMAVSEVNPMLVLEFPLQALEQEVVEIIASQLVVPVAGQDLGDVPLNTYNGHIKGPAAEIINHGGMMDRVAKTVRETGGRWLIEDAHDFQACKFSGLAGSVALSVRKVRRYGNDRFSDSLIESLFSPLRQLSKNQRRDLLGRKFLVAKLHRFGRTHLSLNTSNGQIRIEQLLMTGLMTHEQRSGGGKDHTRRQHLVGLGAQDLHFAVYKRSDLRIRGSEIYTDDQITHGFLLYAALQAGAQP